MNYRIKENSPFAWIASRWMRTQSLAMVLGNTIHLSGVSKNEFLGYPRWVAHELVHVEQFRKFGTVRFLLLYLWESIKKGYYNNRFEVEARNRSGEKVF